MLISVIGGFYVWTSNFSDYFWLKYMRNNTWTMNNKLCGIFAIMLTVSTHCIPEIFVFIWVIIWFCLDLICLPNKLIMRIWIDNNLNVMHIFKFTCLKIRWNISIEFISFSLKEYCIWIEKCQIKVCITIHKSSILLTK